MSTFSKYAGVVVSVFVAGACSYAHDLITTKITWSREISRLVQKRCAACHREDGTAFSLATYEQARPWAKAIKEEVLERRMPPWGAIKGFGSFRDEQGLTQEQLELIAEWVEGGAPEGDAALLPKAAPDSAPEPAKADGLPVTAGGEFVLKKPFVISAIRANQVPEGGTLQVIARNPDGTVEPLLWLYNYRRKFDRVYVFTAPIKLPSGTRIESFPKDAGSISLIQPR